MLSERKSIPRMLPRLRVEREGGGLARVGKSDTETWAFIGACV